MRNFLSVIKYFIFLLVGATLVSCSDQGTPKPWGFHRIILPEHKYVRYDNPNCPYTFEIPVYGQVLNAKNDSCYLDIDFPQFGARWHITTRDYYKENTDIFKAYEDYRELVYKHSKKATEINETIIEKDNGAGVFFELYGEVPTSAQFFFGDTTRYAMITTFYFKTAMKNDSLKPIIDFMKQDLKHLIETIQWKK